MLNPPARERIVLVARSLVGLPYVWGSNTPAAGGMDCSGFAQWCWAVAGIEPWASQFPNGRDETAAGLWVGLDDDGNHALPGDLAFYGSDPARPSHVVIVGAISGVPAAPSLVIGASRGDRTCMSPAIAMAKGARIRTFPSHLYRPDFLGFRRPALRT